MAYPPNMKEAANRHYRDAKKLFDIKSFNNAGYHFGFAAECATKFQLLEEDAREDDDVIWLHFQKLRIAALASIGTRSGSLLYSALNNPNFMQEWDTKMRYASSNAVSKLLAEKWKDDADILMGIII